MPRVPPFHRSATGEDLAGWPGPGGRYCRRRAAREPQPGAPVPSSAIALGGTLRRAFEQRGHESWQSCPGPSCTWAPTSGSRPGRLATSRLRELPATATSPSAARGVSILGHRPRRARKLVITPASASRMSGSFTRSPAPSTCVAWRMAGGRTWPPTSVTRSCAPSRSKPSNFPSVSSGAISRQGRHHGGRSPSAPCNNRPPGASRLVRRKTCPQPA